MSITPTIALLYDFDKTLCTKDMQEYTFIPGVGMSPEQFWSEANKLSASRKMDKILAYMYLMLETAHVAKRRIHRADFVQHGKDLEFFPGVADWFGRMNRIGEAEGARVEHYIISSGLREIIEGSSIFPCFREVFACEFLYDENDVACWAKNCVNYTTKTQFLFRINKGALDLSDDDTLNKYTPEDERAIPFRNMVYIGDGYTDVPCMKLVKSGGGYSVAVYTRGKSENAGSLLRDGRVDFVAPADYTDGGELDATVRDIIRKIAVEDSLNRKSRRQLAELDGK
jgi:hypothetical protein